MFSRTTRAVASTSGLKQKTTTGTGELKMRNYIKFFLYRNRSSISGEKIKCNSVNLEYWNDSINIGDYLSKVVYQWMLDRNKVNNNYCKNTVHLMGIGSIIGMKQFDSIIWGSGIHRLETIYNIYKYRRIVKYDVRAVRGPITAQILRSNGYIVPDVFGDPAILLPNIYSCSKHNKKYPISIISHYLHPIDDSFTHKINIQTQDYQFFINEICSSEKIVSSSLHGIILAEAYGIPAVFLNNKMDEELIKFYDYYYSTGRFNVVVANSLQEALEIDPMPLPDLEKIREKLLESFPYDLWE